MALLALFGSFTLWILPVETGRAVCSDSQITGGIERNYVQAAAKVTPLETGQVSKKSALTRFREKIGESTWNRLLLRLNKVNSDIDSRGYLNFSEAGFFVLAVYSNYQEVYDWDSYFENIYMSYYGITTFTQNNPKLFLQSQREDGLIARALKPCESLLWAQQQAKPFLAQIILLGGRQNGNYSWLEETYHGRTYYERLKLYLAKWSSYDRNGTGLVVWPGGGGQSGMDNQSSRTQGDGVDINCNLVREWEAMAILAGRLGRESEARTFKERAAALRAKIQVYFWDDRDGFFYDRKTNSGAAFIRVKSVAGFIPLWLGIATPAQAKRLVREHLLNSRECLVLEADTSLGSGRVTRALDRLIEERGQPENLRSDNGPEFTSRRMLGWAEERKINLVHIQPGRPMQNGHVESFHGRLRDECLNVHWFETLTEAKQLIEAWRQEYNGSRPHRALDDRTPSEFACQYVASRVLAET
jgi:hypothetical protein